MTRIAISIILALSLLGIVNPASAASLPIVLTDELQLKLGDAFAAEGEYYRAITEYKKLTILFPDSEHADTALFNTGMAYYRGEEYEAAARTFTALTSRFPAGRHISAAEYQRGLALVRLNLPEQAAVAFQAAASASAASKDANRKAVFGKALAEFDRGDVVAARSGLELFITTQPADPGVQQATAAVALLDQSRDMPDRSPLVAGMLSAIVPGSGHIYAGHYGDGITSLLLNGLFIAGTVVAVQQENYALAGVAGLIGLPFYIGNIYGGANAATKWNIAVRKDQRGKLAVALEYPLW